MKRKCSARYRSEILHDMAREPLDLLVIGGGLTAAAIAWDAAGHGLRTGLIEEYDFASWNEGLTGGELPELGIEEWRRKTELNAELDHYRHLAPHTVQKRRMVLPYYKQGTINHWKMKLKLKGFGVMSRAKGALGAKLLTAEQLLEQQPLMMQRRLKGGLEYDEYTADAGRLTIEMLKGAYSRGALICNYAGVDSWMEQNGAGVSGVIAGDRLTKKTYSIEAKAIIIAAGPLNGRYMKLPPLHSTPYEPSDTGAKFHLVIENKHFQLEQGVCIPMLRGGVLEVIPFKGMVHVSADIPRTDLDSDWDIEKQKEWMLAGLGEVFPGFDWSTRDIQWHWESVVPGDGSGFLPTKLPHLFVVEEAALTELRQRSSEAVQVVLDYVKSVYGWRTGQMPPSELNLPGGGFIGKDFAIYRNMMIHSFTKRGIPERWAAHLLDAYGSNAEYIIGYFSEISEKESMLMRLLCAEILYGVEHEMAASAADVLIRRPGLGSIHYSYMEDIVDAALQICAELLEWDLAEQVRQREWLRLELAHLGVHMASGNENEQGDRSKQVDQGQAAKEAVDVPESVLPEAERSGSAGLENEVAEQQLNEREEENCSDAEVGGAEQWGSLQQGGEAEDGSAADPSVNDRPAAESGSAKDEPPQEDERKAD